MNLLGLFSRKEETVSNAIDPLTFKKQIEEDHSAYILDVRTDEERNQFGEIEYSSNVDVQSPQFEKTVKKLPKDYTYYIVSQRDERSKQAYSIMEQLGFPKIHWLKGGFQNYQRLS